MGAAIGAALGENMSTIDVIKPTIRPPPMNGNRYVFSTVAPVPTPLGNTIDHESPADASKLQVTTGDRVRLRSARGSMQAVVEVSDRMQPGHVSLPNGHGLGEGAPGDAWDGTPPNELTSLADKDAFAGTPWHKFVPVQIERVVTVAA